MEKQEKIDITSRYPEEDECGREARQYINFCNCLDTLVSIANIESLCDVGCSDGHLLAEVRKRNPSASLLGIEYFDYHLKYAPENIRDDIKICDIRDDLSDSIPDKFQVVICTEVGEHIEAEYANQMLQNIKNMMSLDSTLVMTWSQHGGLAEPHKDPLHQHLNPLSFEDFAALMQENELYLDVEASNVLRRSTIGYKHIEFFFWWKESLSVWRLKA